MRSIGELMRATRRWPPDTATTPPPTTRRRPRSRPAAGSLLLVRKGSTAYFIEGLGDDVRALDTEALGIMFLESLGQTSTADHAAYGAEFHGWPAAAAGAWLLLALHKPTPALFPSFS